MNLSELERRRIELAKTETLGAVQQRYRDYLGRNMVIYQGELGSLGTGEYYDEDGNVIEPPEDGFWVAGMRAGSAPIYGDDE